MAFARCVYNPDPRLYTPVFFMFWRVTQALQTQKARRLARF